MAKISTTPWEYDPVDMMVVDNDGDPICEIFYGISPSESEADAYLIAAAPALKEALDELLGWVQISSSASDAIAKARAALALCNPGSR